LIDRDEDTASNELENTLLNNVPADSSSIECLSTAQRWMKACLSHHKGCRRSPLSADEQYFLPTRVINVGDGHQNPFLYLVSKEEMGSWVSLSYCWGGDSDFVLTKSTFRTLVDSPDLHNFPQTIQDAIIITRNLGMQFLWVDALCIFQDSLDDWQSEAPKMESVYHNAVLTIVAADSPAVSTGIFKQRDIIPTCSLPWKVPNFTPPGHLAIESEDRKSDLNIGRSVSISLNKADYQRNYLPDPSNSRWASRGWTLQEDLLSWRTLSYTSTQVLWGCSTLKVWEDGQLASKNSTDSENPLSFHKYTTLSWKCLEPHIDKSLTALYEGYNDWYQLVTVYSSRQLTKEADRLAAIEGLARKIQPHFIDSYCAGLWKNDLIFGLIWAWTKLQDPSASLRKQNPDLAWPSWIWTSLHDQVRWCFAPQRRSAETGYTYKELGRIESVSLDYSTESLYGMVNKGELVLSAPCHWLLGNRTLSHALRDIMEGKQRASKVHTFLQEALVTNREFQQRHRHHSSQEVAAVQLARVDKISAIDDKSVVAPPEARIAFLVLESIQQDERELEIIGVRYRRVGLIILDKIWAKQARKSDIVANEAFAELETQAQWPLETFRIV
jgi:hypothetical protein